MLGLSLSLVPNAAANATLGKLSVGLEKPDIHQFLKTTTIFQQFGKLPNNFSGFSQLRVASPGREDRA